VGKQKLTYAMKVMALEDLNRHHFKGKYKISESILVARSSKLNSKSSVQLTLSNPNLYYNPNKFKVTINFP